MPSPERKEGSTQPFPIIKVELNGSNITACPASITTVDERQIKLPIPYQIETHDLYFEPRDLKIEMRLLNSHIPQNILNDIEAVVRFGRIGDLKTLLPVFSSFAPCSRGIRFADPSGQFIYVLSGIGMGRFKDGIIHFRKPAPSDTVSRSEYEKSEGLAPASFTRVNPDGTTTTTFDDNPQGAYTFQSRDRKVAGNTAFRNLELPVGTPQMLIIGDYPQISFRGQPTGWLVYRYPVSLWPYHLSAISQIMDDRYPYTDRTTGYLGNRIFESWLYKSAQVVKMAHDRNITQNQLHPGNTGMVVDKAGRNHPLFTDMDMVTDISHFNQKRRNELGITAHMQARINDLVTFILFILRNETRILPTHDDRISSASRLLAWLGAGYWAKQGQIPDLRAIILAENRIQRRLEENDIESRLLKISAWSLLSNIYAGLIIQGKFTQ